MFVSYPRGGLGHTWAEAVQKHLESLGAEVWRDEDSIREGEQDWCRRIEEGLAKFDVLICVVGQDTDQSDWQKREMLRAVELRKPIVPLRIAAVGLPFYIQEKQPVEVRQDRRETMRVLTEAVFAAWRESRARDTSGNQSAIGAEMPQEPATVQRRREIAYLNDLIHVDYSDREALWVPLEGSERRSHSLARSMKTVRMDTDAILRAFHTDASAGERPEGKTYTDVLDAYRDLQHRSVRRLAVLGEPGAGKSFSLERIAVEYSRRALDDPCAPLPLLVPLGLWTRDAETLEDFIERQLGELGQYFQALRNQKRAVLLLDAMNEIPPGQRKLKANLIQRLAQDERFASVVVSCREKDFEADFRLHFDTLVLQPLKPRQILDFLRRALSSHYDRDATEEAETRFWQMAGGAKVREVWEIWQAEGEDLDRFWTAVEMPLRNPDVSSRTSSEQNIWWEAPFNSRSLIRLVSNPYLLVVMTQIMIAVGELPDNRAQLFQYFLHHLYERERSAREKRHDTARVPDSSDWERALATLAETMQRKGGADASDGAQTALPQAECPATLSPEIIDFSVDASVLQLKGEDLRFTHQLLQEYLASRVLLEASRSASGSANHCWPSATWWERSGWEVVSEIAAESLGTDGPVQAGFIAWLAEASPEVACEVWRLLGHPPLPEAVLAGISGRWLARMTEPGQEPHPYARAAIGRALGRFGLDRRKGVGLRPDGLPDIDWMRIPGERPFVYQDGESLQLPTFHIARYPITHAQFQAFIDAGGYRKARWWQGLARRFDARNSAGWEEPNAPRERVSWYEALAFCRWLSERLGYPITLPTEQQWERAARGTQGYEYPWGEGYRTGFANCNEPDAEAGPYHVGRTTAVGIYPQGGSPEAVLDLTGNVWEWCLNEYHAPENTQLAGDEGRVVRGGSWRSFPKCGGAVYRGFFTPGYRGDLIGFRVCCGAAIETLDAGTRITGSLKF